MFFFLIRIWIKGSEGKPNSSISHSDVVCSWYKNAQNDQFGRFAFCMKINQNDIGNMHGTFDSLPIFPRYTFLRTNECWIILRFNQTLGFKIAQSILFAECNFALLAKQLCYIRNVIFFVRTLSLSCWHFYKEKNKGNEKKKQMHMAMVLVAKNIYVTLT